VVGKLFCFVLGVVVKSWDWPLSLGSGCYTKCGFARIGCAKLATALTFLVWYRHEWSRCGG